METEGRKNMYDVIIIGAGVIGASVAYFLSQYDLKIAMVEALNDVCDGTTKSNAAIIHAGYDAKPNTLMAKYNRLGAVLTKELCEKLDVPYKQNGSLVLAYSQDDVQVLKSLLERGKKNGVEKLHLLDQQQTRELNSEISKDVVASLYAETAAIINPWEFGLAMIETAVKNGMELFLNNEVKAIEKQQDDFVLTTSQQQFVGRYIINATGVAADKVFELIGEKEFTITPVRGQYYLLDKCEGYKARQTLFPCPSDKGKGCAVTPTVSGNLVIGPDAEVVDYNDRSTTAYALNSIREMALKQVPSLNFRENIRNFAGIRARSDRGDFIIEESKSVKNFFNLAGMASPGLSSSSAIGRAVAEMIQQKTQAKKKKQYVETRKKLRFMQLDDQQKNELIRQNPAYGRIVCRCESITEGEILDCFNSPVPPVSIDGVKRRVKAGLGRCQGGFCGEKVAMILKQQLHLSYDEILKDKEHSNILLAEAKKGEY